jgi:signal transduction histidine kinase
MKRDKVLVPGKRDVSLQSVWVQAMIVLGSVIAYILLFQLFIQQTGVLISIFLAIPVIAAGIYFGRIAGVVASLSVFTLNFILLNIFEATTFTDVIHYWPGYLAILVIGYLAGSFHDATLVRKRIRAEITSRERFIMMTRMATRGIVGSKGTEEDYYHLATQLANMFVADYAYLIRWDDTKKQAVLIAATKSMEKPFSPIILEPEEAGKVIEVMQSKSPRIVENALNSASIINPSPFRDLALQTKSALIIPLAVKEYSFGVAILAFDSRRNFSQEEIAYVELASNQITLALFTIQQQIEIETQLKEARTLSKIEQALSETERIGTNKVLQLIVDSARDLIQHAEESVIHLVDEDGNALIPRAISGFNNTGKRKSNRRRISLKEGVAGHVIATSKTVNIGNINESPLYVRKDIPPSYRSLLVSPVQSGGQPIGTISVQSNKYNAFSSREAELLNALSVQAAIAIENTRLFEITQQGLKEVNALYRISQGLASSLNTDELINEVVNLLQKNFGYYHVQIYLLDRINGDPVLKSGSGGIGARMLKGNFRLPKGVGIVGHTVETASPFVTNDVNEVIFFFRNPLLPDTQSEIAVPIKVDEKVVGAIDVQERPPRKLTDNDMQLVVAVAEQLSVALQKATLYSDLQNALKQEQTVRSQLVQSERLALVGRLLASVSHELNNPLQAIQNALFLLKDEEQLSSQGRQDLDVILSEAERMASLIERLRGAYRPGRVKDFRPLDINNLIEDVHTLISTFLRQKQIAFEFHPDPDLPPISGMSDQMRQVVLNLFLNAIEVMKPGGRLVARTLSLPQQNEILFVVKDTGPGIEPELLPKIFDAFITDKQTGTGLGLTITRDIIEQHFGRIEAKNDPGGGAVFNVWLPFETKGRE